MSHHPELPNLNRFRGHPDGRLWRWPLRRYPVAICRLCAALVADPLAHAAWHARMQRDA
jgi:hypothetical protein